MQIYIMLYSRVKLFFIASHDPWCARLVCSAGLLSGSDRLLRSNARHWQE